jgi:phosphatidylethanolamine-binding protein (PEBP) family uncharacterized protein
MEVAGTQRRRLDRVYRSLPPPGPKHRYVFTIFAVDRFLALPRGASPLRLIPVLIGHHIRASVTLVGVYSR